MSEAHVLPNFITHLLRMYKDLKKVYSLYSMFR